LELGQSLRKCIDDKSTDPMDKTSSPLKSGTKQVESPNFTSPTTPNSPTLTRLRTRPCRPDEQPPDETSQKLVVRTAARNGQVIARLHRLKDSQG